MKPFIRYALLLSAVVVAGGGFTMAAITSPPSMPSTPPAKSYVRTGSYTHGRSGGKFFNTFDANHDGKVTRDEFNRTLAQDYTQAAGAAAMGQPQFIAYRLKDLRQRTDQMFHRADWNGDGRLSLDEYAAPERVRFEYADRDGTGVIVCGSRGASKYPRGSAPSGASAGYRGRSGGGGRAGFCKSDDLNHDGRIDRAEFDKATAQEFAAAAKGGTLTPDQFYAIVSSHLRDSATHMFARLDTNHDGKLDRAEFAAPQARQFARMDRNNDGVVTRDEASPRRYGAAAYGKPGRT